MKVITRYFRIYFRFWQLAFSLGTVYRVDSLLLFVAVALFILQSSIYFGSILRTLPAVAGWTFPEYMLLLATFSLSWGFFKLLYGRTMEDVIDKVFTGQYDYYLLKPINVRFLSYFCPPLIKSFPSVTFNILFVVWVIHHFSLPITSGSLLLYVVYLFVGQITVFSFSQVAISTSFFTTNASDIYAIFENAWDQASYPGEAFTKSTFFLLSSVVPIILFASFPTRVLLGHVTNYWEYVYPFVVALICLGVSNTFYKFGIKNYTSAGG